MSDLLVGIDVGTTNVKAVVIDTDGRLVAESSAEHGTLHPHPGWAEQDSGIWWSGTVQGPVADHEHGDREVGYSRARNQLASSGPRAARCAGPSAAQRVDLDGHASGRTQPTFARHHW